MADDFETKLGYGLGVASIILAFVSTVGGLIAGIIGFNLTKKHKTDFSKRGKKLNVIGIVLSLIILIFVIISFVIALKQGLTSLPNFPIN